MVKLENGEMSYEGEAKGILPHGQGKAIYKSGETYEGKWENGSRNGFGINTFPNGALYEGMWTNGAKNGFGTYFFEDGRIYEGDYIMEVKTGRGKFTYTDGAFYDGMWKDHNREGMGEFHFPDGAIFKGNFHVNDPVGHGIWTYPNGNTFEGEFDEFLPKGRGILLIKEKGIRCNVEIIEGKIEVLSMITLTIERIKEFFLEKEIDVMVESFYEMYRDYFNACNELTGYRLTDNDVLKVYDFISQLITYRLDDIEEPKTNLDLISIQYKYFEVLLETRGKFSEEEKLKLAYCFFASIYIKPMDIKTGEPISMIKNLGSVEGIEKGYEKYCEVRPEMFDFPKEIIVGEKGLVGFSKDNPIMRSSISIIYYYINNMLTLHGEPLKFVSQSLVGARMDRMKISYMSGYEERFVELYFNGYAKKDSWAVPKGFRLGEMIGS